VTGSTSASRLRRRCASSRTALTRAASHGSHLEWLGDSVHAPAVGNASAQARALDLASTLVHMLGWRRASWCARIAAILQRGIDSQALLRFSQVRVSTGRLVAVTLLSRQGGELVRCIVERAAAQSEALELLLVIALADAMLSPAFVDELPRIVPTVLEGQRDNDPERALMARHTAALLVQYGMSAAHVDALLGTLRTLVVTSVVAVALPMLQPARVSQPLCAAAHRRVGARDCARGTARRAHRGARKRQRPDRLGAGRPGAVARRRAASRRICHTGALERRHSAARRCARLSRTTCRPGCSTLRRRWRSTRLPRRASAATPRAVPRPSSSARASAPSTSSA
jgi:hypothetical protein